MSELTINITVRPGMEAAARVGGALQGVCTVSMEESLSIAAPGLPDRAALLLRNAADQFRAYQRIHEAKANAATHDYGEPAHACQGCRVHAAADAKAAVNRLLADRIEEYLEQMA